MKDKVISRKQLPTVLPLNSSMVCALVLDRVNAAGWVWGVCGTLFALAWVAALVCLYKQNEVEIPL